MSTEVLHAWVCGDYVGYFERGGSAHNPRFMYDGQAKRALSLSIPLDGSASRKVTANFLQALLPESPIAREAIQVVTGASSSEPWELLKAIGGDLQGGLVMHPDADGLSRERAFTNLATEDAIAARIGNIKQGATGFEGSLGAAPPRFSLAGAQSKFALAIDEGSGSGSGSGSNYFWSDSATPSTHILKPEGQQHSGLELIESAALELARRVGIDAPVGKQVLFGAASSFIIPRFDRRIDPETGLVSRLHVEDMTQALGVSPAEKYEVHIDDICEMLRINTGDDELGYAFMRQYAFNVIIGNTDAHDKNYSLFLDADSNIRLTPLYDAIPIGLYPSYGHDLAMPVGFEEMHYRVNAESWVGSAKLAGLDVDRVRDIVAEVATGVLEHVDGTVGAVEHPRVTAEGIGVIKRNAERQVTSQANSDRSAQ